MLNLGRNSFTGSMQSFYLEPTVVPPNVDDCQNFPNPFSSISSFSPFSKVLRKIHFGGLRKSMSNKDEISPDLQTLILYENKLTGTLPNELTRLTNLVDLNLADNDLTGPLPLDIGKLNQLNVLDLHGNLFTGPIPENVGQLRQLKILNLYGNFFDGSIPNTVGNLFKLDELLLGEKTLIFIYLNSS